MLETIEEDLIAWLALSKTRGGAHIDDDAVRACDAADPAGARLWADGEMDGEADGNECPPWVEGEVRCVGGGSRACAS